MSLIQDLNLVPGAKTFNPNPALHPSQCQDSEAV